MFVSDIRAKCWSHVMIICAQAWRRRKEHGLWRIAFVFSLMRRRDDSETSVYLCMGPMCRTTGNNE